MGGGEHVVCVSSSSIGIAYLTGYSSFLLRAELNDTMDWKKSVRESGVNFFRVIMLDSKRLVNQDT